MSRKIVLPALAALAFAALVALDIQRRLPSKPPPVELKSEPVAGPKPEPPARAKPELSAAPKPEPLAGPKPDSFKVIRIEVLNGCGVSGIAEKVSRHLRDAGFDVMTWKNADSFNYPETIVIDRTGNLENARRVASAMGLRTHIQQIVQDPYLMEQVAVIVGMDYDRLGVFSRDRRRQ
jgi:hypothetical protein